MIKIYCSCSSHSLRQSGGCIACKYYEQNVTKKESYIYFAIENVHCITNSLTNQDYLKKRENNSSLLLL